MSAVDVAAGVRERREAETAAGNPKIVTRCGILGLLETVTLDGGRPRVRLLKCPVCDHQFGARERRSYHIADHDPEDFGLSPIGERRVP